jgi:RNA-binding protein
MPLTSSQKRHLKGLAHRLKPVVMLGQQGVSPGVLAELDTALEHHELVKVKLGSLGGSEPRERVIIELCAATGAERVQTIGHVAVLYRPARGAPRIRLP